MNVAAFALRHAFAIPLVFLAAYMSGRRVLRRLEFGSLAEELAVCGGMGVGLISTALFALGLAGAIRPAALLALLAAALASGGSQWRAAARRARLFLSSRPRNGPVAAAVLLVAVLPFAALALYPPTAFDSTLYHLPVARAYAAAHGIVALPFVRFSMFPQVVEMLATGALALADDVAAQQIQVLLFLLAGLAGAAMSARLFSSRWPWLPLLLWLASPLAVETGTSVQVEGATALFGTLALLAAGNSAGPADLSWAAAAGAFAGLAAGTKYLGLFFVVAAAVVLRAAGGRGSGRRLGIFALAAAAAGAPWYLRTAVLTGNPVFPFLNGIFRADERGQGLAEVRAFLLSEQTVRSFTERFARLGRVLFDERLLAIGPSLGYAGFAFVAGWAAYAVRSRAARRLLLVVGSALALWFWTAENPRFLIPVLPLAVVAGSALMETSAVGLSAVLGASAPRRIVVGVAVAIAAPAFLSYGQQLRELGPPPATVAAREAFLEARFPEYGCYRWLNGLRTPYRLFGFFDERMTYYAEGERIGDYFGPASYARIRMSSGGALDRSLRLLGVDYVLFPTGLVRPPADETFARRFRLVCSSPAAKLYAVRAQ